MLCLTLLRRERDEPDAGAVDERHQSEIEYQMPAASLLHLLNRSREVPAPGVGHLICDSKISAS